MKWSDLFRDPKDGTASTTKLWTNVGFAALTIAFLRHCWVSPLTPDLILAYGGTVCLNNVGIKWIARKYDSRPDQ